MWQPSQRSTVLLELFQQKMMKIVLKAKIMYNITSQIIRAYHMLSFSAYGQAFAKAPLMNDKIAF